MTVPLEERLSLTPLEVEALTGVSARTVRELVKAGRLRRVPYTSRVVIPRCEVDRWLAAEDVAS